ncbi:MAG: ATP-binding protein, partial [Cyclobacteriaceae bacterium]
SITIWADRTLVEQVLINLVKNAVEALEDADEPKIILSCGTHDERAFIEISDNGPGMDDKLLDQIFVPFFSTKSAGSGIGLSLSRQIMRAHQGKLQVHSGPGKGSSFRLIF